MSMLFAFFPFTARWDKQCPEDSISLQNPDFYSWNYGFRCEHGRYDHWPSQCFLPSMFHRSIVLPFSHPPSTDDVRSSRWSGTGVRYWWRVYELLLVCVSHGFWSCSRLWSEDEVDGNSTTKEKEEKKKRTDRSTWLIDLRLCVFFLTCLRGCANG